MYVIYSGPLSTWMGSMDPNFKGRHYFLVPEFGEDRTVIVILPLKTCATSLPRV